MPKANIGGDEFTTGCDLIDVTSNHRPDTGWRVVDIKRHEHRWYVNGAPATSYDPSAKHETPTLLYVFERWGYWEDGDRYAIGHHECRQCGEHIEPGYTASGTSETRLQPPTAPSKVIVLIQESPRTNQRRRHQPSIR